MRIFMLLAHLFREISLRMYLPLDKEVKRGAHRFFRIYGGKFKKKHPCGFIQFNVSTWPSFLPSHSWVWA